MEMKKLLEVMDKFAGGADQKQGPAGQLKGGEQLPKKGSKQHPAHHKLVGGSCEESLETNKLNFLKELDRTVDRNSLEWQLSEEYATFLEDDLGVEPKRPHRKGSRADQFGPRGHKEQPRYKTVKESSGDGDVANTVVQEVIKLIGEGHTEVSPDVITTKVSATLGRPFMLKDLVAANNGSPELQHYIDSINPSKIKFSTDILTVKNQDPAKEKEKAQNGVANMASRAANRSRLGEGSDLPGYGDEATWGGRTPYDDDDFDSYGIKRTVDEVEIDLPPKLEHVIPSGILHVTYEFDSNGKLELHSVESYDEEKNEMIDVTKYKEYLKDPIWSWIEKYDLDNYDEDYKRHWQDDLYDSFDRSVTELKSDGKQRGYSDDSKERDEFFRYERSRSPMADVVRKKLNLNQKNSKLKEYGATSTGSTTSVGSTAPTASKSTGAIPDAEQLKKVATATSTIKAATSSPATPDKLAQTLSKASSGQSLSTQDMQTLQPMMGVVGKAAQDPNLANQFKSLANLAKNIK